MGTSSDSRWLDTALERLREAMKPELVVLFGSRARGTQTRKSDLDLLVIVRTEDPPLARIARVLHLLADSPWPVEAIVLTPEELATRRESAFMRRILSEGKVLYESRAA